MTALDVIDQMIDEYLGFGLQQAVLIQARERIAALPKPRPPEGFREVQPGVWQRDTFIR